jgi:stage IV sporulation protein FB
MSRGWWTIGHLRGAPIRVHWSLPLGALLWSNFSFAPAFWLSFTLLILVHELGHALFVLRFRLGLSEVALHGLGGYCAHERSGSRYEESVIAWGGVLAQLALFVVVQLVSWGLGPPRSAHAAQALHVLTTTNLWVIALNLLPIGALDGAKAWPLVGMLLGRLRGQQFSKRRTVADELRDVSRVPTRSETPDERTDRLVRELIARTTQSKER